MRQIVAISREMQTFGLCDNVIMFNCMFEGPLDEPSACAIPESDPALDAGPPLPVTSPDAAGVETSASRLGGIPASAEIAEGSASSKGCARA